MNVTLPHCCTLDMEPMPVMFQRQGAREFLEHPRMVRQATRRGGGVRVRRHFACASHCEGEILGLLLNLFVRGDSAVEPLEPTAQTDNTTDFHSQPFASLKTAGGCGVPSSQMFVTNKRDEHAAGTEQPPREERRISYRSAVPLSATTAAQQQNTAVTPRQVDFTASVAVGVRRVRARPVVETVQVF